MDISAVLSSPAILEAAWLRIRTWYHRGAWMPQPEFSRWELDADSMLEELGEALASRSYAPSPMLLLPHAKKKGRLRHYCQPSVRDQVAFMVFGVLLAPLFEERMHSFSFGNRWYRGLTRREEGDTPLWSPRNWSLADRHIYQPYRRAHGLFRRTASWTVDAMLGSEPTTASSLGPMADPDDFRDLLPDFASKSYWQFFSKTDRVYWAGFDLKLAFPSVRIHALRQAMKGAVVGLFPNETPGTLDLSSWFLSDNLRLFDGSIRQHLMERSNVETLVEYFCDLMEQIRYLPFDGSDELFFPNDSTSPNPALLPLGSGSSHPGLPTGLAVCGMLLNVYLHPIDEAMADWYTPRPWLNPKSGQPAAFLRFADDMVLLAGSPSALIDGIGVLMNAVRSQDSSLDLNLQMNWDKAQPQCVADMLERYRKPSKRPKPALADWVARSKEGQAFILKLERVAINEETRGPFVTELVERLSDLGAEKQIDLLPEQAKVRLARLQELVLLKPDDSVVPRETQLVFAANHLVRAWLPEEDRHKDASLLADIRRSVAEAMRGASDKPRLWRAVWRIAIRRPTSAENVNESQLQLEDDVAKKWLLNIVGRFAENARAERFLPPGVELENETTRWWTVWTMFSSFQRAAIWRAFASVARDVQHNSTRLAEDLAFAPPHSWLYRSSDEQTLQRMTNWLQTIAHDCLTILYSGSNSPLPIWESEALAVALLALMPRSLIVRGMPANPGDFTSVVSGLIQKQWPDWSFIGQRLHPTGSTTSLSQMLLLTTESGSNEAEAAQSLAATTISPRELLRIMTATHWRKHVIDATRRAAHQELSDHPQRLAEARADGPAAVRRELNSYQLARQSWLACGGNP